MASTRGLALVGGILQVRRPRLQEQCSYCGVRMAELVVEGRLSPTLIEAIGFDVSCVESGRTHLVGHQVDQELLHRAVRVLRDLNIELISLNELPPHAPPTNRA
jgi:hypothetical protein